VSVCHQIYGLRIAANRAIPGLRPLPDLGPKADLCVHLQSRLGLPLAVSESSARFFYTSPHLGAAGQSALRVGASADGSYFGFFYGDGAHFAMDRHGRELWADWPEGYSIEDAATYLVGPVLGFVLRLRGITPLHASAIAIDNHAIALVGVPGAGKSTTAAAFAHLGFGVLSDDVVALEDAQRHFLVAPGYPRVNLWSDAKTLFRALPRLGTSIICRSIRTVVASSRSTCL
jgi:hypothetical protein